MLYDKDDGEPLKALFLLQAAVHAMGWPTGLLEDAFMKLYQNDVISEEAFMAWKDDLSDTPGKMQGIMQVNGFLTWLEEQEDDEEESESEDEDY